MKKQIFYLFVSNLAILFVGMGVFPLLPVYAAELGATPAMTGIYLALTYVAITLGSMLPGWLAGRLPRRVLFIAAGALGAPAVILLGQAASLWQAAALTAIVWFTGGVGISLVSVMIGLYAEESQRGKWFSLISLTTPLGAVIGGLSIGWLVSRMGYGGMFAAAGLVYGVWPLAGLIGVREPAAQHRPTNAAGGDGRPGKAFQIILAAVLLSAMTVSVTRLGLSLSMKAGNFSAAAISGANVVGGLATLPVVLGLGALSDRLGRRGFLAVGYLLAALSGAMLVAATHLWQYWVISAAMLVARSVSGAMASALATDLLPREGLGRSLPWLGSMSWVAGIVGFAGSGYIMETLGASTLYWMATAASLGAAGLLGLLPRKRKPSSSTLLPQGDGSRVQGAAFTQGKRRLSDEGCAHQGA